MNLFGDDQEGLSDTFGRWRKIIAPSASFEWLSPAGERQRVDIVQNSQGFGELGTRVWDASYTGCEWLARRSASFWDGKRVLELGAGTGLMGIVAARCGASMVLSDKRALLPLIRTNVTRNGLANGPAGPGSVEVAALHWGTPYPAPAGGEISQDESASVSGAFDVCVGADLTYDLEGLTPLIQSMRDVAMHTRRTAARETDFYIFFGRERAMAPVFVEMASPLFDIVDDTSEPLHQADDAYPVGLWHARLVQDEARAALDPVIPEEWLPALRQ